MVLPRRPTTLSISLWKTPRSPLWPSSLVCCRIFLLLLWFTNTAETKHSSILIERWRLFLYDLFSKLKHTLQILTLSIPHFSVYLINYSNPLMKSCKQRQQAPPRQEIEFEEPERNSMMGRQKSSDHSVFPTKKNLINRAIQITNRLISTVSHGLRC